MARTTRSVAQTPSSPEELMGQHLFSLLLSYLESLLARLDDRLDKRLVRTFILGVVAIVQVRHRAEGLWLRRLGSWLLSPRQAVSGAKRLWRLLRKGEVVAEEVEAFLLAQGDAYVAKGKEQGQKVLAVWDDSEWEKPSQVQGEGMCWVRSLKGERLQKAGSKFGKKPRETMTVPGMHWMQVILTGLAQTPVLVAMRWWSSRGAHAQTRMEVCLEILTALAQRWEKMVIHIWDRGFAGAAWLLHAAREQVYFILRWPRAFPIWSMEGRKYAVKDLARRKRSQLHRYLWDRHRRCWRRVGITYMYVFHPSSPIPLTLVIARLKNRRPWYLLTNIPVSTLEEAWDIVRMYYQRWDVETSYRLAKSEWGFESVRVHRLSCRRNLLAMASIAHAFLLYLWYSSWRIWAQVALDIWAHRPGRWTERVRLPLYRLRMALSFVWQSSPPMAALRL